MFKLYAVLLSVGFLLTMVPAISFAVASNESAAVAEKTEVTNLAPVARSGLAPVRMQIGTADRILIRGYKGDVIYKTVANRPDVMVQVQEIQPQGVSALQDDDWQFNFQRERGVNGDADTVVISVDGPASKKYWSQLPGTKGAAASIPEYDLVVTGPSRPLQINWHEGRVQVAGLGANLDIANMNGETIVKDITGDVTVAGEEGAIQVSGVNGHVHVDTYNSTVKLKDLKGELTLENFIGASEVASITGDVTVTTFRGSTQLSSIKGNLEFKDGNGPMHIEKFQGQLRGQSAQGPIFAEIEGQANVRMRSEEGAVNLQLPESGAWVNLGTNEGQMWVPKFLKLTRLPSESLRTGRLHGSNGGSIFVRTTSGEIRIR